MRYTSKPQLKRFSIISEDLVTAELTKTQCTLNKAMYAGFSVLELSKLRMFEFHYKIMVPTFESRIKLCFSDTDSFLYAINTSNLYKELVDIKDEFDFSNYPKNHFLYSDVNKDKPGKFKDEAKSFAIKEFVGLRAKCYSILMDADKTEKAIAAGIKRCVAQKSLRHQKYLDILLNKSTLDISQKTIRSYKHRLYTQQTTRTGLSSYDDKRFILSDGVHTRAHGHRDNNK